MLERALVFLWNWLLDTWKVPPILIISIKPNGRNDSSACSAFLNISSFDLKDHLSFHWSHRFRGEVIRWEEIAELLQNSNILIMYEVEETKNFKVKLQWLIWVNKSNISIAWHSSEIGRRRFSVNRRLITAIRSLGNTGAFL